MVINNILLFICDTQNRKEVTDRRSFIQLFSSLQDIKFVSSSMFLSVGYL
jgi:hypothetical protein